MSRDRKTDDLVQYEVSMIVREDLCESFESFMIEVHIPEVMETEAFSYAQFSRRETGVYRASYLALSRDHLTQYLAEHSPRLRESVVLCFPEGIEFSRDEWTVLAAF